MCRHGAKQMQEDSLAALDELTQDSPLRPPARLFLALAHLLSGALEAADEILVRAVDECTQSAAAATGPALAERAVCAMERGDWRRAGEHSDAALAAVADAGLDGYLPSILVFAVGSRVAIHRRDLPEASRLMAKAHRLRPLCTDAMPPSAQFLLELARAHVEMADPAGARSILRQVQDVLYGHPRLDVLHDDAAGLSGKVEAMGTGRIGASAVTAAELRVIPFLASHLTMPQIAERLNISRHTAKSHTMSVYRKLGVSSRAEAIDRLREIGLLESA
jgi:LuxR family maltose regulon positive regulatory protein